METSIALRAGTTLALIVLGVGLFQAWNRWHLRRLNWQAAGRLPGLESLRPGVSAVLYFTAPDCAPCRTLQRPALEQLQNALGDRVQVIELDAMANTQVADHWGVLSVPTTIVIDTRGQARRINHGVATRDRLAQQLSEIGG
jgi:thiol-disulfide isomerase/thioredoxin